MLYSGTGALKVGFTQYGKQTMKGQIDDGQKAVTRYFINNFYDVYNQNALDLMLGKIKPQEVGPVAHHSPTKTLGMAAAVSLADPDVPGAVPDGQHVPVGLREEL